MKLYGYQYKDGKMEQAEIEVEEKVVLVPKGQASFPLTYDKQLDIGDIGKIVNFYPTIFLKSPDFEYAKEKFLVQTENELSKKEDVLKTYQDLVEGARQELESLKQATSKPTQGERESEVNP